jgi:V8-like Glu-specific endopeptidase
MKTSRAISFRSSLTAAMAFLGVAASGCDSTTEPPAPPSYEEQLSEFDPAQSPDWQLEGVVPQRAREEGETLNPAVAPNVPNGEYLILADGRMFRYVGQQPLPEALFQGGAGSRGEDLDSSDLGTLNQGIVIGTDDRSVVTSDTTLRAWPHRTIGSVIYSATATSGGCTATMIGPRHAVTAAHCLHDGAGTWYWPLFFSPGHKGTGADRTPNGAYRKVVARYARTYDAAWDYGLMILEDRPETASLGWLGFGWWSSDSFYENRALRIFGYPLADLDCAASPRADGLCGGFMYQSFCSVYDYTSDVLYHRCDTQSGNSGSALQSWVGDDLYVIGVHKGYPSTTVNYGPRFTQQKASVDLCGWIKAWPSSYATRGCN